MELFGLALVVLLALVVVIFFTRGAFAKDLTDALKRVNQQERALQEKADILEQRLRQLEVDYHAKLKSAQAEAERLVHEAKRASLHVQAAAVEEAKYRARQLMLEAEQGRTQLKAEVAQELDARTLQRVCQSLRVLLTSDERHRLHSILVQELLETVRQLDGASVSSNGHAVHVMTAVPLHPDGARHFEGWAKTALGPDATLVCETDERLVAGGVVRVGAVVVDNSLANRLANGV